ncbi:MAG: exodeoxyribonuclease VII large subunit [Spartobacteria bacterium]|nr:exodeoxyribonuclease VII large subunit [Spartobacteria bacterium]
MFNDRLQINRKVYKVTEITRHIKTILEDEVGSVWIEGELSNVSRPASGHMYFSLKDATAQIKAAFFKGSQQGLDFALRDGLKVRVYGNVTVYERTGQYQIIVRKMEEAGKGSLQEAFEKLKARLGGEGLFDAARKKPIPQLPQCVGVVTSPTGAAIRDILNVISRRFPNLHILIVPTRVQGEGAAAEIAAGIDLLNEHGKADVMIVGRGGGSMEDLWCFNEEVVARAIARSTIPVISAVGHEVDFTISDFVADMRAPTPSAAAELVVAQKHEFEEQLTAYTRRLVHIMRNRQLELRNRFIKAAQSYVFREPRHLVQQYAQQVDSLQMRLNQLLRERLHLLQRRFAQARDSYVFKEPAHLVRQHTQAVTTCRARMLNAFRAVMQKKQQQLRALDSQLRLLNPYAVLDRGYSITRDSAGRVIRDSDGVEQGAAIITRLAKGMITSRVEQTNKETLHG